MKTSFILIILLVFHAQSFAQPNIIFDTDIGADADDLAALTMLNNLHNNNECNLLAVISWSIEEYAIPAIDAVNTYYGNADIPVATRKHKDVGITKWNYNHKVSQAFEYNSTCHTVPDAVTLYRKILANEPDTSVTIVAVGPLKNIEDLLNTKPDTISSLNGFELVHKKVKEFVIMGGQFPEGDWEWNFCGSMEGVTQRVLETIKCPITFLGYELGKQIETGSTLNNINKNSPLYIGYLHFSEHAPWMKERYQPGKISDNASYDQTAVYYAVRNGVGQFWTRISNGKCVADEKGGNKWVPTSNSNHSYLVLKENNKKLVQQITDLMLMNISE